MEVNTFTDIQYRNELIFHTLIGTVNGEPWNYGLSVGSTRGSPHTEWGTFE